MLKRLIGTSLLYTLSGILSQGISFLLLPVYTRVLAPADYGLLDYLTILGGLCAVSVALEIGQGVARFTPEVLNDRQAVRSYASTALWFTAACYAALLLIVLPNPDFYARLFFHSDQHVDEVRAAVLSFALSGIAMMFLNQLRFELRVKEQVALSLVFSLSTVGLTLFFLIGLGWGVAGAFWARTGAACVLIVLGLMLARSSFGWTFDRRRLAEMLSFSLPLVPSSLGVVLLLYIDRLSINSLMTIADVGVYGIGVRIASIATLLVIGLQSALTPLIYATHKDPETPRKLVEVFRLFCAGALMAWITIAAFSPQLIQVMTTGEYAGASQVVPYLVLVIFFAQLYLFAPGLNLARRTVVIACINLAAAALNLGLNYLLIPQLGIVGAAVASVVSTLLAFVAQLIFSQRIYPVAYRWTSPLLGLAVGAGLIVGLQYVDHHGLMGIGANLLAMALGLVAMFLLGLFRRSDVASVVQTVKNLIPSLRPSGNP